MSEIATPRPTTSASPATQAPEKTLSQTTPTLGDYRLVSKIGQGGIAEIYKGIQASLDREVAVKILSSRLSSDSDIVRRFDRESKTIARLSHPNIVHVIDRGFAEGRYYFVMEYVEGASFKEILTTADVPLRTRLEIIVMTLKGLDYAHKNGVIHRDIKPANILIDKYGNAKVADFGIAHIAGSPDGEATRSDIVMGTMAYMSPEQKLSSANVDATTDIYAVGVMLYEALLGQKPLGKFKLPSEVNSNIPAGFDRMIECALASDKRERYQSAVAMKDDLLDLLSHDQTNGSQRVMPEVDGVDSIIGTCRFLDTIRETSYGATYLVENRNTRKLIVIKRYNSEGVNIDAVKALRGVTNEHIVNILGAGADSSKNVVVMEYAPGGSLADRMVRTYDWPAALAIVEQIARGLAVAHQNHVIHGNLRPSNVLFDADEIVKLSDFGSPPHYTSRRNWYSPPERGASERGDIYALGVILYQMLFGTTPEFTRHGQLHLDESDIRIPDPIRNILRKALALQSSQRYQSCDEFLADWTEFQRGKETPVSKPATETKQPEKAKQFSGMFMLTIGLLLGIVIGVAISYFAGLPTQ